MAVILLCHSASQLDLGSAKWGKRVRNYIDPLSSMVQDDKLIRNYSFIR